MTDDRRRPRLDTLTPIPTEDVRILSRNISKLGTSITRMEEKLDTVKDDLLPPVSVAAKEARDGVLQLQGRVSTLEEAPPPSHECVEGARQMVQDGAIASARTSLASISKMVWWILGLAVVVGGSLVSFAILTSSTAAETATHIEGHEGDLSRLEKEIDALEKAQREDRDLYLREMRALPTKVQQVVERRDPTLEEVLDVTPDFPLTEREEILLKRILENARKRSASGRPTP